MKTVAPDWSHFLDEGEVILWHGPAEARFRFRPQNLMISAFGLFFLGFSLFWTFGAAFAARGAGAFGLVFPLFGLPFIAVGLWLVIGNHIWDHLIRRSAYYTLTNRRAFISRSFPRRSLKSWPITAATAISFYPGPPDTIIFAQELRAGQQGSRMAEIGFEQIAGGAGVYRLMLGIQSGAA